MRLENGDKTDSICEELYHTICQFSFEGVELPSYTTFRAQFFRSDVFVYVNADKPAGFAFVEERNGTAFLWCIAVAPLYRQRGLGATLLCETNEYYTKLGWAAVELVCRLDNVIAQTLYLKNGYRVVKTIHRYYGSSGDGLLMRKSLGGL